MKNSLIIFVADGRNFALPVVVMDSGCTFVADQPARAEELNVIDVRLNSEELERPVRFILESFILEEGEAGCWAVTLGKNDFGIQKYDLEYYATEKLGKAVRSPALFYWNHQREEMTGD